MQRISHLFWDAAEAVLWTLHATLCLRWTGNLWFAALLRSQRSRR